jgi:hypothetical protein
MRSLPREIVDSIICKTDIRTNTKLYDSGLLQTIVSKQIYEWVLDEIHDYCKRRHKKLLHACLECLQYHVWEDGTPMKNRTWHSWRPSNPVIVGAVQSV